MWLKELYLLAMSPADYGYLREVSARFWRELRRRGEVFDGKHFSDHMHEVLRTIFPHAPGSAWDAEWADDVARRAVAYVGKHTPDGAYPGNTLESSEAETEMEAAGRAEDRRSYRRAVGSWAQAMIRAARKIENEGV